MADSSGPFDGSPWQEDAWFRYATRWAPNGILTAGDCPLTTSGLTATIGIGRAWVAGAGFQRTSPVPMAITANTHGTYSRRDRVVLRRSLSAHSITPVIILGTPAVNPIPPTPAANEQADYDLPLFSFLVPPASGTTITGVVDERVVSQPRATFVQPTEPTFAPDGAIWFQVL